MMMMAASEAMQWGRGRLYCSCSDEEGCLLPRTRAVPFQSYGKDAMPKTALPALGEKKSFAILSSKDL